MRLTLVVIQGSCFFTLCTAQTAVHWNVTSVLFTAFTIFSPVTEFTVHIR